MKQRCVSVSECGPADACIPFSELWYSFTMTTAHTQPIIQTVSSEVGHVQHNTVVIILSHVTYCRRNAGVMLLLDKRNNLCL